MPRKPRALRTDVEFIQGPHGVPNRNLNYMGSRIRAVRACKQRIESKLPRFMVKQVNRTATAVKVLLRKKHNCYYKKKEFIEAIYSHCGRKNETDRRLLRLAR